MAGDYASALQCLLCDDAKLGNSTQPDSVAKSGDCAAAAFAYIDAALHGGRSAPKVAAPNLAAFKRAVIAAMGRLVEADGAAAARLILKSFPGDHAAVLASLESSLRLQYCYLKGAMQVRIPSLVN